MSAGAVTDVQLGRGCAAFRAVRLRLTGANLSQRSRLRLEAEDFVGQQIQNGER